MPSRDLEVNIDGDATGWNRALRAAEKESAKFRKEVQKLEGQLKKHQAQMEKSSKSATLMRGEMATLVAAGATVAPAFLAAGAGIVAFAGLAVPSIMKVIQAQQDLAANWDTLSQGQKVSAVATRNLITQYKDLAKSLEPEALDNFNASLGVVSTLMPKLVPIARESSKAFLDFQQKLGAALDSQPVDEFFSFLEKNAGPAIGQVTDASMSLVGAAGSLIQALAPLASSGLTLVRVFADLVGGLAKVSPELAQLVTLAVALRGPLSGAAGFLGDFSKKAKTLSTASAGASKATKLLNLVTSAGPNLYLAAGTALAFVAIKAATAKTSVDKLVESLTVANHATGNNVAGYKALNAALANELTKSVTKTNAAIQKQTQINQGVVSKYPLVTNEVRKLSTEQKELERAYTAATTASTNVVRGADAVGKQYGIQAKQAIVLADAIGIDMSQGILENGKVTATTAARFEQYMAAVTAARNPTMVITTSLENASNEALALKDRVTALSAALDAFFNPSIGVYQATTAMKNAFVSAAEAVKKSNGDLTLHNATSRAARDAFAAAATSVTTTAGAVYKFTSQTQGATAAAKAQKASVVGQLPELARLAGKNKDAQNQVAALAYSYGISGKEAQDAGIKTKGLIDKINALHSKKVDITARTAAAAAAFEDLRRRILAIKNKTVTITAVTRGSGQASIDTGRAFHATGGMVRGPGTGTSDSVPIMASNREFVVNAKDTARTLPLLQAINAGKYAQGGLVKGYASGGQVATSASVPINEFVSRYIGDPYQTGDLTKANTVYKGAVAQLRAAEKKLADDRKKRKSKKTIRDDEARVAKERLDLADATNKLRASEEALRRAKLSPAQKLQSGLTWGIKNTGTFIANITKLSDMGFGALAQQLLAEGGPEAEAFAASAVKMNVKSLAKLNTDIKTASSQQDMLAALPNLLKVKDAIKSGAKGVAAIMQVTGLSEEEIAQVNEKSHLFASGGIRRPGVATGPMAIFGEAGPEAFIPYDRAHRSRAMGLVNQVAADFGMVRRSSGASRMTSAAAAAVQHVTNNHFAINNALDPNNVAKEIEKVLNRQQRDRGRTSYSFAR